MPTRVESNGEILCLLKIWFSFPCIQRLSRFYLSRFYICAKSTEDKYVLLQCCIKWSRGEREMKVWEVWVWQSGGLTVNTPTSMHRSARMSWTRSPSSRPWSGDTWHTESQTSHAQGHAWHCPCTLVMDFPPKCYSGRWSWWYAALEDMLTACQNSTQMVCKWYILQQLLTILAHIQC